MDSGACCHLIAYDELTPREKRNIRVADSPQVLQTANGLVTSSDEVDLYIESLNDTFTLSLLRNTPTVLSQGLLCVEKNCPYLQTSISAKDRLLLVISR